MAAADELTRKRCQPCEGGVGRMSEGEVASHLVALPEWDRTQDGKAIRRTWKMKDFAGAMAFLNRIAELAEDENHHPDLHLTGYRDVAVEITTHAIGGLSENDFILAAKIDQLAR